MDIPLEKQRKTNVKQRKINAKQMKANEPPGPAAISCYKPLKAAISR